MGLLGSIVFGIGFAASVTLLVVGALLALTGTQQQSVVAYGLLGLNLAVIVVLAGYLALRLARLLSRQAGQAAPILHRRFVLIFSLVALAPAVLVGAFATSILSQNIDDLFGDDIRDNLGQAKEILDTYVRQELTTLQPKLQVVQTAVARDPELLQSRITLTSLLQRAAFELDLDAIYVLRSDGLVLARTESAETPAMRVPAGDVFELVAESQLGFQSRNEIDYLMALAPVPGAEDTFLYVGDYLRQSARVLSSIDGIEEAGADLERFTDSTLLFNRTFFLMFLETALLMLMAAVLMGTFLANRIIEPLGRMILASEKVREGDLAARVAVDTNWGEISDLSGAFNRMTEQLSTQRAELIREHDISERQRRFSEAVLSGVTAGVVGLSEDGRVTVVNASAERLLGTHADSLLDRPIGDALPAFAPVFRSARESLLGRADDQVEIELSGEPHTFDLRVSSYEGEREDTGWVLTFDDMTRLVAAQRHSAWREVARRIAHEIKNPLTPIQLSAERLQRKFEGTDLSDAEQGILRNCTDTILRAVGNMERMVDEFSSFARMPEPQFEVVTLADVVDAAIAEQGVSFPDVRITRTGRPDALVLGDERLLGQALTNLIKNAAESVERAVDEGQLRRRGGKVVVNLTADARELVASVTDNGVGWPDVARDRLVEPYATTRVGGTGLGLAIVQRIVEDHGGQLELGTPPRKARGAVTRITLPLAGAQLHETAA